MVSRRRNFILATTAAMAQLVRCPVHAFSMRVSIGRAANSKTALSAQPDNLLSNLELPSIDLTPSVKAVSAGVSAGVSTDMLPVVGAALVVLAGAAFFASGKSDPSVDAAPFSIPAESEKIDLSIPYDAAARLAYREMKGLKEGDAYDEEEFLTFKTVYEDTTIANVIVKKMERDLRDMQAAAEQKAKDLASLL